MPLAGAVKRAGFVSWNGDGLTLAEFERELIQSRNWRGPCEANSAESQAGTKANTAFISADTEAPVHGRLLRWVKLRTLSTLGTEKGAQVAGQPELVHAVTVRANMRSILVAMMKSFSCSPLIFLVSRDLKRELIRGYLEGR
jgi:hypothetical protein